MLATAREDAGHLPQGDTQMSHPNHQQGEGGVSLGRLLQQQQQPQASQPGLSFPKSLLIDGSGEGRNSHSWVVVPGCIPVAPPPLPFSTGAVHPSPSSTTKLAFTGILLQCCGPIHDGHVLGATLHAGFGSPRVPGGQ